MRAGPAPSGVSGVDRRIIPMSQAPDHYDPRTARPARHVDPRARRGGESNHDDDGALLKPIPSLGEIEMRLMRCDDELTRLTMEHYHAAEEAAEAESDWKRHRDRVLVMLADRSIKEAADIREARAKAARVDGRDPDSPKGEDLYHTYKLLEARERSIDRHLRAVQVRSTTLMSVAKGVRGAGG